MARRLWDIGPAIDSELDVWPGDTPPTRRVLMDRRKGDTVTLSTLEATVHLGAHADAPSHYGTEAASIEAVPVERYVGPCEVVHVAAERGGRIPAEALPAGLSAERVLLRTDTFDDPTAFNEDFAALSAELVRRLADRGAKLIGVDTPSVDLFHSKSLEAHTACLERDVVILEGLRLGDVAPGRYELIAVPLRLVGFDGSPIRPLLREL